jgi:hypothetical protein
VGPDMPLTRCSAQHEKRCPRNTVELQNRGVENESNVLNGVATTLELWSSSPKGPI